MGRTTNGGGRVLGSLRYDRARRRSADEDRQAQLCQIMWSMRHVALTATLVAGLSDGRFGSAEWLVGSMLLLQITNHVISRVWRRYAPIVSVIDAALLLVFTALGLPPLLVFLVGIGILGWAATFRPVAAIGAYLVVIAAVVVMVNVHVDIPAVTSILAFCMLGAIFMVRSIRLNMGARRADERETLVSERVDAVLWEELPEGRGALKVNVAAERLFGYPVALWARPGFVYGLVHPEDRVQLSEALNGAGEHTATLRLRRADGEWRWLELRSNRVTDRTGRITFHVGVLLDRTEQVEAEQEALAFGHLVAVSPIGQMLLGCDGRGPTIDALNHACQRILGVGPDVVGSRLDHLGNEQVRIDDLVALFRDKNAYEVRTIEFHGAASTRSRRSGSTSPRAASTSSTSPNGSRRASGCACRPATTISPACRTVARSSRRLRSGSPASTCRRRRCCS